MFRHLSCFLCDPLSLVLTVVTCLMRFLMRNSLAHNIDSDNG
jgi:hypothetical protein